ncbi:MAG: hypothetical protein JRN35_06055 [Nitrososphaerota archaeon]|nr:hypothetical protein [Nitrososphaerota archaeon]
MRRVGNIIAVLGMFLGVIELFYSAWDKVRSVQISNDAIFYGAVMILLGVIILKMK